MNDDLISRSALKNAAENLVAGGEERLIDYYKNGSKSEENGWIGGVYDVWELIIDAPKIETTIEDLICTLSVEELKATTRIKVDTPSGEAISFRREKTGQWVADDYAGIHCSECDYIPLKDVVIKIHADGTKERGGNFNLTPYCPNCGAYMRGGRE